MSAAVFHALRLQPGDDVMQSLVSFAADKNIRAGFIASCVGSLLHCTIRFANQPSGTVVGPAHFEIVSLVGTVAVSGCHVHISLSDGEGKMVGGHLMVGSAVYTTCELVIGDLVDVAFGREPCAKSGYDELAVHSRA
jgi:predicted DNA-binding protein with PD1-like motif